MLYGVTHVPGTKVVWAVGNIYGYRNRTLAERWNGTAWSLVSTPNVNSNPKIYNVLQAVTAISSGNIWAVGYTGPGFGAGQTLIEHRNGSGWSVVSSPSPGGYDSDTLDAITEIAGSGQLLAVGTYQDSQTTSKVIIESYC